MRTRDPLHDPEALIRRVYGYAAYRLGAGAEAEDVTAETMERAVRYRSSSDPAKGRATDWIVGIARHCVDDALAARRADSGAAEARLDPELELETDVVQRLTVAAAVSCLSDRDRELIGLRYGSDLSARQIARHLGMRTNAVEVALHRALARLRPLLDETQL